MNEDIKEDYVSYELSKFFKEKEIIINYYGIFYVTKDCGEFYWQKEGFLLFEYEFLDQTSCPTHDVEEDNLIPAYTIALVVKWLRVKYGIHIYTDYAPIHKWFYCILDLSDNGRIDKTKFDSPEQAYEAGIRYCLENLIPKQ